jgi:hypothetical protein
METYRAQNTKLPFEKGEVIQLLPPCETCKPEDLHPDNFTAMEVLDRCGDEWITAGMEGIQIAISGPSIETAMNISGIFDQMERTRIFDQVKMASRKIAIELIKERNKGKR